MVVLLLAAALSAQPAPATAVARVTITIMSGAEVHSDRIPARGDQPLERRTIRGEDGQLRPAMLREFQ